MEYSSKLLTQKLSHELAVERELTEKMQEYEKLGKDLLDIAKHSTKQVMVPVSDVAFFPGKLKHSNEILVFLGDGYFVQRTAHECQPIIARRQLKLQEQLDALSSHLTRKEKLRSVIAEAAGSGEGNQTRWTEEGLLDIRELEEKPQEAKRVGVQKVEEDDDDEEDEDDF